MHDPTLETPRLKLRAYRASDFDAYAALWADPQVVRFIGGEPFSRPASWARFLRQIGQWSLLGFGYFALEHKEGGAFVGEAGFQEAMREMTPSIEGTLEAGWATLPAFHGQGLAEEAMRAILAWAGENAPRPRATAIIDPENRASLRLAGKLGFGEFSRTLYAGKTVILLERPTILPESSGLPSFSLSR